MLPIAISYLLAIKAIKITILKNKQMTHLLRRNHVCQFTPTDILLVFSPHLGTDDVMAANLLRTFRLWRTGVLMTIKGGIET